MFLKFKIYELHQAVIVKCLQQACTQIKNPGGGGGGG